MNTPDMLARRPPNVAEVHVIWMTTGLGCDGDSVSVTAASLPSIEDLVMGNIPGLPKVHLHNPVLAYEVGDDFMEYWFKAAAGKLDPFVLVLEGSVPNEKIKKEGYWAAMGTDPDTAQPITTNEWIDRLAGKHWPCSRAGPAPPMAASMPWKATRPERWAWQIIWAGAGSPRPGCPS